jgi:hypothetical protein
MLHMGYVNEVLFGCEVEARLPEIVKKVGSTRARQVTAKVVLLDQTALL